MPTKIEEKCIIPSEGVNKEKHISYEDNDIDPILKPSNNKLIIMDDPKSQHRDIYNLFMQHHQSEWFENEEKGWNVDLKHFKEGSSTERRIISHILAFFAPSDGMVLDNLCVNLMRKIQIPESRMFFAVQMKMEVVHALVYNLALSILIEDETERDRLRNSIDTIPVVKKKAEWTNKWIYDPNVTTDEQLVAFAVMEGLFFSSSFAFIYWLKRRNRYPTISKFNEWIARDEGLHTQHGAVLHKKITKQKMPSAKIRELMIEATALEREFVRFILDESLPGMNATDMCHYVEYVADRLMLLLGETTKIYNTTNPFPWMDAIGRKGKSNFHEHKATEYVTN